MPEPRSRNNGLPASDTTRDHLANERTLLAWSRTGIAIMALGFVVARFNLALRMVNEGASSYHSSGFASAFGVVLVVCGAGLLALALKQYLHIGEAIERGQFHWSPAMGIALVGVLVLTAILLAIYLIATA